MTLKGSYRQSIPGVELSIEKDTENVPNDGKFHVLMNGDTRGTFRSLKQAQELFNRLVRESGYTPVVGPVSKKSPAELAAERYLEAKDFYWADSHKYRGRGGRGGRGGV